MSPLSYTNNYFALNLVFTHSLSFFIITKTILWLSPFLQLKVSAVNYVAGSFCWNYATHTFYSNYVGGNVWYNYAGFEVLLQLCWLYFLLHLCWWIFLYSDEGDCFWCNYAVKSFCNTYTGESLWSKYVGDNFI